MRKWRRGMEDVIITIPGTTLSNIDLIYYAEQLSIPHFKGVFMSNQLPSNHQSTECGIMNLNKSNQAGSHWVAWLCLQNRHKYYFDSYGQDIPIELQRYLKTNKEFENNEAVVRRNAIVVQHVNSSECGRLCLFVLCSLSDGVAYDVILTTLKRRYDGKK